MSSAIRMGAYGSVGVCPGTACSSSVCSIWGALWWLAERVATDARGLATAGPGGGHCGSGWWSLKPRGVVLG